MDKFEEILQNTMCDEGGSMPKLKISRKNADALDNLIAIYSHDYVMSEEDRRSLEAGYIYGKAIRRFTSFVQFLIREGYSIHKRKSKRGVDLGAMKDFNRHELYDSGRLSKRFPIKYKQ